MSGRARHLVLCNGAEVPPELDGASDLIVHDLDWRRSAGAEPRVRLHLPQFVDQLTFLPPRFLDLLEIAAYVFALDRQIDRGHRDSVEFEAWSRAILPVVRVRDHSFWQRDDVRGALQEALTFMSGDRYWEFRFQPGHATPPANLFDSAEFAPPPRSDATPILFSGGIDSLCGALHLLTTTDRDILLISHQSGQPGTKRTQRRLAAALCALFPDRVFHYIFECGLRGVYSAEESQRTRAFLYTAIGCALVQGCGTNTLHVFENGVTALNLPKRPDMLNARASRTTHPKTLLLLRRLYSLVVDRTFELASPFWSKTKAEVLRLLARTGHVDLLPSSVSCSRTFQNIGSHTHCGVCSQCVDRRFAVYAAEVENKDDVGIYDVDFVTSRISHPEARTLVIDYVRQARDFANSNPDFFYRSHLADLTNVAAGLPDVSESDLVESVWKLCRVHGEGVQQSIRRIQQLYDNPYLEPEEGSLLTIVSSRDYLRTPVSLLVKDICDRLERSVPLAFRRNPPVDEADLKDKMEAILNDESDRLRREHPAIPFALGHAIPDFSSERVELVLEVKYIRKKTTPSKVAAGIAEDMTKYPENSHKLFVVYDPDRAIADDREFAKDFESRGGATILVLR